MEIIKNKSFKKLTTFRIGGKVKYYVEVKNVSEIKGAIHYAKTNKLPIFVLGGGSDFLASDNTFEGLVIKYSGSKLEFETQDSKVFVTGEGGLSWDKLVEETVKRNLAGLECLSGIPGTVGASPIQNVGAYGQEMSNTFYKLLAFSIDDEKMVTFTKDECKFGYRESVFKNEKYWQRYLITNVTFKLDRSTKPNISYESLKGVVDENATLQAVRNAVLTMRNQKLEDPEEFGNAGSFFKNPIIGSIQKNNLQRKFPDAKIFSFGDIYKVSAAWLIDKCGWKGREFGGAAVSSKHVLILINKSGKASAEDVYNLSEIIIHDVYKKTGIKLEREVQLINF